MQCLEKMHESMYACHIYNASFQKKSYFYYFLKVNKNPRGWKSSDSNVLCYVI